jgi:hypothetical protein
MGRAFLVWIGVGFAGLATAADPSAKKQPSAKPDAVAEAEQGEGVSLTIYNEDFVVVKDRRVMDLRRGRSTIHIRDVAATIVPESVQFSALRRPDVARVAEQNYEFDLVSADKLLDKYIDRDIGLVARDGEVIQGKLLSFDDNQLVLRTRDGIDMVPRVGNVKDVRFSSLPGGLLTRPTLVWKLDARASGKELVKVAYRADKMTWRVDYRAQVNEAGNRLRLAGWVTVTNNTGTAFKDAQVKLMAGDVHVVRTQQPPTSTPGTGGARPYTVVKAVTEKSFAEYHLYELGRKTAVRDHETKQVELLNVADIPVTRGYEYRGQADGSKVAVVLEFKNSKKAASGLGVPLPKGPIRVFQRDQDGELEFAGTDNLDHTPKDEPVRIRLGSAFDLAGEYKVLATRSGFNFSEQDVQIQLRNHKQQDVHIDVVENINGRSNWSLLRQSHPMGQRDVNTLVFPVEVNANGEATITYTIRYNW